jgi:hypothetical protein
MLDNNGEAVSVDPSHRFRAGDRVRIFLETNTDGYLYIFHTENGGNPQMIFPDARLNAGENFIGAHVPTEIPSSLEPDERLRWFVFDQNPATERLYVVVTRTPLPLIPTGQNLISYCRANQGNCPWRPVPEMWAQFQAKVNVNTRTVKAKSYGQAQTARQRESATRGLGLDQSAPPPSIIRMNATSNAPVLITALDLIHR